MTETPPTTARRTWALTWRLALPWVVCGGLLWALVGLTPEPIEYSWTGYFPGVYRGQSLDGGLAAGIENRRISPHPIRLAVGWSSDGYNDSPGRGTDWSSERFGFAFASDRHDGEWLWCGWLSLWWLLPLPLLWSAFNLWRWVRRGN
ncbi:hypothetical protein [Alienimonas sp. DA493]|uniref:hypothetical protein n=1 Tax=Alienimonas sp. DA493 TaxID=3373605 RepID=UPI0037545405